MPGRTIAEKILSRRAGSDVAAGDICVCDVDAAMATDGSAPMAIDYFRKMGGDVLPFPDRVVFAMDHYGPPLSPRSAALQEEVRAFCRDASGLIYDVGTGIGHQLMVERGHVSAGGLYVGADSHSVTYGALNSFAAGVGSSDLAAVMLTGALWFLVPETIRLDFRGSLPSGVSAKDAALWMTRTLRSDGAAYRAVEFSGTGIRSLSIDDRFVLSNMVAECGAKAGIFPYDDTTEAYLTRNGAAPGQPTAPDDDARYEKVLSLDLNTLGPLVAVPDAPDNVCDVGDVAGTPVDAVYLGTCTGGRVADFHDALAVLRKAGGVATGVKVYVTPASDHIMQGLVADGSAAEFVKLGAVMMTPGCGACCGTCGAIPGDSSTVVSTANRNFKGRMGNPKAAIYLASPMSCAAAAATGKLTDPREILA